VPFCLDRITRPPLHSRDKVAHWLNRVWHSRQFICNLLFVLFALLSASFGAHATLANFRADCGSSGCHLNGLPAGTAVANGPNFNTAGSASVFNWANGSGPGQGNMGSSSANIAAIVAYIESVRPQMSATVTLNTAQSITIPDLYFNSALGTAGGITNITITSGPMAGASVSALSKAGNAGSVTYTPKANYCGGDTFNYQGTGAAGTTTIRTATINIPCPPSPVITSGTTASGTAGVVFGGYTVTASNGPTSFGASGLPPGLSINTSTGVISGTPTTGGTFNATVTASNANPVAGTRTVTFTIIPASPVITSGATATGTIGTAFGAGYTITATNTPTSFSATGLPPGLSVIAGTGVVTGTPTSTGTFTATVSASNANPTPGTKTVTFTIFPAIPVITSGTAVSGTVGTAITPYQITATNSPTTFTAPGLPGGLSINASGLISGTPTVAGTFNVTVSAANTNPTAGTQTVVFTIVPPIPVISSAATASGQTGVLLSPTYTITASNNPTVFGATGLPSGLTLNTSSGVISGTPTTLGVFNVTLTAQNANPTPGTLALVFTITLGPPVVTSGATATGAVASVFAGYQITATNGPLTSGGYGATGLPPGLAVNASGLISGTPTTSGTFNVQVTATNATATSVAKTVVFTISQFPPVITSPTTASGQTGVAFSYQITASNGTSNGFSFTGTLPPGLTLNTTTGLISGTPTAVGSFTPTLVASNGAGNGNQVVTFTIGLGPPVITSAATAAGSIGIAFSYQITATNNPTSFNASGLPPGLTVNATGLISGTPTSQGAFSANVTAQNGTGTGNQTVTITIGLLAPVITSAATASGTIGLAFSYQVTASNNPTSYGATGLPAGLSINATSGLISGAPTVIGSFNANVSATNATGTGSQPVTISIALAAPIITSASTANGGLSQPFNYQITANNFPTSFSATGLPPGLSVNTATGLISGAPGAVGVFNVTVNATNSIGTGSRALTLSISNAPPPTSTGRTLNVPFNTATQIDLSSALTGLVTSIALASQPAHGTAVLAGNVVTYTPTSGYFGADSFTFIGTGPGGASAPATVSITVGTPPIPTVSAISATATFNTASVIDLSRAVSGVYTSVTIVTVPTNGTVMVNGQQLIYTPRTGYFGADSFTYTVTGPGGTSAVAEIAITVSTLAPTANGLNFILPLNVPTTLDLLPFITGSAISGVVVVTPPAHGVATVNGTKVTFTPATDYFGGDSFTYAAFGNAGTSPPATVKVTVTGRPDPTKQAAVTGLIAAQAETAERFAKAQISNFQSRMESLHRGDDSIKPVKSGGKDSAIGIAVVDQPEKSRAGAFLSNSYAAASAKDVDPLGARPVADPFPFSNELASLLASRSLNVAALASGASSAPAGVAGKSGPNFWIAGTANFGLRQANSQRSALDFSTSGISLGVDQRINDQLLLGVGAGFARDKTEIGNNGSNSRATGYSGVVYASYQPSAQTFVDGLIGVGSLDFKTKRYVSIMDQFANGNRSGIQVFGSIAAGYEYRNNGVLLSPYGRFDFSSNKLRESSENGAGQYALTFFGQTATSLQGVAGLRAESIHDTSFGTATPRLRLEYRREFKGSSDGSVGYADLAGGSRYGFATGPVARNALALGFGADFIRREGLKIGLDYELLHTFNRDTNQSIRLSFTQDLDGRGGPLALLATKPKDIQVDAGYTFDSNVTRAKASDDKRSDRSTSLNAGLTSTFTFNDYPNIRALVTYSAGGEKFQNFDGLSRASAGLQGELQYRPSSDFDAPTFSLTAQATGEYFQSVLRRGVRSSIAGSVRMPITDRISLFGALAHNERDARSDVFTSRENAIRSGVDFMLSGNETIYLNGEFRKGHFVSTGKASLENLAIADVFVFDDSFLATDFLTYRTKGKTVLSTLGYNRGLGERHSLDLSWRRILSTPDFRPSFVTSPRSYVVDQYSLVYLMRF
jgi:uncharacterized protein YhjY with autotransporter beta-barrel domain